MASELPTSSEFIRHHLTNLTFGQHPDGSWGMAHTNEEVANMGFMAVHVDSLFWSFVLGALFLWLFRKVAVNMTTGTPGGTPGGTTRGTISTPSVVLAWFKLRSRSLGPILDSNGWAVNGRAKVSGSRV